MMIHGIRWTIAILLFAQMLWIAAHFSLHTFFFAYFGQIRFAFPIYQFHNVFCESKNAILLSIFIHSIRNNKYCIIFSAKIIYSRTFMD